jgi:hypothetical protein
LMRTLDGLGVLTHLAVSLLAGQFLLNTTLFRVSPLR